MEKRKKPSIRKTISLLLIIIGGAMILTTIVYELVNYPWVLMSDKPQDELLMELADPPEPVYDDDLPDYVPPIYVPPEATTLNPNDNPLDPTAPEGGASLPDPGQYLPSGDRPSAKYTLLGVIKLPKIGVSANIYEGDERGQLSLGCGHTYSTAMPGEKGNCAVAGHRNLISNHPFRYLDKLEAGDIVSIKSKPDDIVYTYIVYEHFVVDPSQNWVLGKVAGEDYVVTLITCDPVINPVNRLIVRARLTEVDGVPLNDYLASLETTTPPDTTATDTTAPPSDGTATAGDTTAADTTTAASGDSTTVSDSTVTDDRTAADDTALTSGGEAAGQ